MREVKGMQYKEIIPFFKQYGKYLFPTLIAVLSNSLYCIVDVYFISSGSGNMGIAALNIAMPIFTIYSAVGLLFGFGSATLMSIADGKKDKQEKNEAFTLGIFFMVSIGLLITIYTVIFPVSFARMLGASDLLLPYVLAYLKPICISSIPFILMYSLSILLRSDHNPKLAMYALMIANIFNIIMDYVCVEIFEWGIFGAAFATSLSPIVSVSISLLHFKKTDRVHFTKNFWKPDLIKRMFNAGAGSGAMELSTGIIIFIFNLVILYISDEMYLAAYGIITNIAYVIKGILNGFAQAAQPMISYYHGAKKYNYSKYIFYVSLFSCTLFSMILYLLFLLFSKAVCIPFADGNMDLILIASHGVKLYFSSLVFTCINVMIMNYLQATEQGKTASFMAVGRGFVFILLSILILVPFIEMDGIWLSVCSSEILCLIISVLYLKNNDNLTRNYS